MKRLPANTSAADLRIIAHYLEEVAGTRPEELPSPFDLADRIAKSSPEDADRVLALYLEEAAKIKPRQQVTALILLDRAAKLSPEDDETTKLRARMER